MSLQQAEGWARRRFLGGLTLAGIGWLVGLPPRRGAAEPAPETTPAFTPERRASHTKHEV